jgi:small subunit ribosomal protein S7
LGAKVTRRRRLGPKPETLKETLNGAPKLLQQKKYAKLLVPCDPKYKSRLVTLLILRVIKSGKKYLARRIVYRALKVLALRTRRLPLKVLLRVVRRVIPRVGVKKRRVQRRVFYSPVDIGLFLGTRLSIRWIVQAARRRRAKGISFKLAYELMGIRSGGGWAIRQKYKLYKLASTNKAFKGKKKFWKFRPKKKFWPKRTLKFAG